MNSFLSRKALRIFAVLGGFLAALMQTHPVEAADPLERKVANTLAYNSVDEAVDQLSKATALKVTCPEDTKALLRKVWVKKRFASMPLSPEETIQRLIEATSFEFGLAAKFSPEDNTIHLDIPWRATDPRSAAELLHFGWKPGYGTDFSKDPKWQNAFNSLLCKEGNFAKACTVRQTAYLESFVRFPGKSEAPLQPLLQDRIVNTSGEKYVFFLFCNPIAFYPGNGTANYYWFKEDGTLVGAGMMNTGHRCALVDSTIDNEIGNRENRPSELQMVLKCNTRAFMIARYALENTGLKLTHFTDIAGLEIDSSGLNVGQSSIEPAK